MGIEDGDGGHDATQGVEGDGGFLLADDSAAIIDEEFEFHAEDGVGDDLAVVVGDVRKRGGGVERDGVVAFEAEAEAGAGEAAVGVTFVADERGGAVRGGLAAGVAGAGGEEGERVVAGLHLELEGRVRAADHLAEVAL